jgi:hypothetical protein
VARQPAPRGRVRTSKEKIIVGLVEARQKILDATCALPPEKQGAIFLGVWSVKDLIAHLVGWDYTNARAVKEILAGDEPSFYAHYDRDWATYNAHLVGKYKKENFAELLRGAGRSHKRLINFLSTIPAKEFDRNRGSRRMNIARLLRFEICDEHVHCRQIQEFADTLSHE